ncbi:MAG TPA: TonB-dependent receptor [Bacteroidota bacterium]|nr:TonB-dependent receptor [Bacteroidota bacterium]
MNQSLKRWSHDVPFLRGAFLAAFLLLAVFAMSKAQESTGEIRGKVVDTRGEPLVGANVLVSGTAIGSTTNIDGEYVIRRVPAGQFSIVARFVGYKSGVKDVTVQVGGTVTVDFALQSTTLQMDEVIVTGQGVATERRRLPTAVESITSKEIDLAPVKDVGQLLQGRIPGLQALSNGGMPGSSVRLMTRGVKSALSQPTPVIYVDGVRVDNNYQGRLSSGTGGQISSSINDLVAGEIDRIEITKGGASSTLFGAEAANGVIQIFTKKGIPGAIRWNGNITTGYDDHPLDNIYSDYTKQKFFQKGIFQSYRLGATGGNEAISYNVSGKISQNTGTVVRDKLDDKLYNLSSGLRVVSSDLSSIEVSASYTRNQYGIIFNDNAIASLLNSLETEGRFDLPGVNRDSLFEQFLLPDLGEQVNRFISSANFNYTPFPWWDNKFTIGVDYRKSENRHYVPLEGGTFIGTVGGYLFRADREYKTITLAYTGSFKLPEVMDITQVLTVGAQGFRVDDREVRGEGRTFRIPGTKDFDNASTISAFESNQELFSYGFLIQDQVGIWDRLFLDLGVRFDGNSTFGKDVGIQVFPKFGVAYNISQEAFWPEFIKEYWSSMKLRASWGQTGTFPPPFSRDRTFGASQFLNESALTFGNPGNSELKPEKTTSIDVGFDAGFLDEKFSLEFSYYKQVTRDAMFSVTEDPAAGLGFQRRNVGEITNDGIEITLRATPIDMEDVQVNFRGSFATINNVVSSLGGAAPFTIAGFAFAPQRVEVGKPVGIIRANKPRLEVVDPATGRMGYRGNSDEVFIGSPFPTRTISASAEVTLFRDLTLSGLLEGAWGHYVLNQTISRRMVNALSNPNLYQYVLARIPQVEPGSTPYNRNTASAVLVEPGDWFKLREIALRYRVPRTWLFGVNGMTLVASVRNVARFGIKAEDIDPETSFIPNTTIEVGGIVGATVEPPRQYRFGIDFTL